MTLNGLTSLHLDSAGMAGVYHLIWFYVVLGLNPGLFVYWANTVPAGYILSSPKCLFNQGTYLSPVLFHHVLSEKKKKKILNGSLMSLVLILTSLTTYHKSLYDLVLTLYHMTF